MAKPIEISIVTFDGKAPVRSWVKKMTRRHALQIAYANKVDPGTTYTVEHVLVDGNGFDGHVVKSINVLNGGVVYKNGQVPYEYR